MRACFAVSRGWTFPSRRFQRLELCAAFLLGAALCAPAADAPILTVAHETAIDQGLATLNMTRGDLAFAKDVAEPQQAIGWIRSALSDPLIVPTRAQSLRDAVASRRFDVLWSTADSLMGWPAAEPPAILPEENQSLWEGLDPRLTSGLALFLGAAKQADALLGKAYEKLNTDERRELVASWFAPVFRADDRADVRQLLGEAGVTPDILDRVQRDTDAIDPEPAATRLLELQGRIDHKALREAVRVFLRAALDLRDTAMTVSPWPSANVAIATDLGKILIGPDAGDTYSEDALLILTGGGRTTYTKRSGSANGLLRQRLTAIIDLGGNDTYSSAGLLGAGTAVLGLSVIIDQRGDDVHAADWVGQAAAAGGVAVWIDEGGDDVYRAGGFGQAAATCGLAILRDRSGEDLYDVGFAGQGFAGVDGFALLADDDGNDRYLAGGREPDFERNERRFMSLAQGFSIGLRPFAGGGVAALVDRAGNDTYVADVYGQGVSYWYSAGFLLDEEGQDTYNVHQYGQGSGIHLSLGLLFDGAGDDRYTGGTLVQGNAHDYAVGFLVDRQGNDSYTADEHGQGRSMNNSFAILADDDGDDVYSARKNGTCQGIGNEGGPRRYGSLAMLLDAAGNDQYTCGAKNGIPTLRPLYGVILDQPDPAKEDADAK